MEYVYILALFYTYELDYRYGISSTRFNKKGVRWRLGYVADWIRQYIIIMKFSIVQRIVIRRKAIHLSLYIYLSIYLSNQYTHTFPLLILLHLQFILQTLPIVDKIIKFFSYNPLLILILFFVNNKFILSIMINFFLLNNQHVNSQLYYIGDKIMSESGMNIQK